MGKHVSLLRSFLALIAVVGILYGATKYSDTIRFQAEKLMHLPQAQVAGAHVKNEMTARLKTEASSGAATAKNTVMHINVSDTIGFFSRVKKIGTDVQHMVQFVTKQTTGKKN